MPLRTSLARQAIQEERDHGQEVGGDRFPRTLSPDLLRAAPVTELLHARLEPQDVSAIEAVLEPAEAALWETADELERKRLALAFAAHRRVEPALSRTGLSADMPPAGVHAMAQGAAAAGGSTYYADLVADSLRQSGLELSAGMAGLDFGCSSGRVVRVLAAAYPELSWSGCDPIEDAIDWARAHLPGIEFERSPERPPLPYRDGQLRLRLRDLDLEPLRRGRGARLAARDRADPQARRALPADDPRRADGRAHPSRGRALGRAAR